MIVSRRLVWQMVNGNEEIGDQHRLHYPNFARTHWCCSLRKSRFEARQRALIYVQPNLLSRMTFRLGENPSTL